MTTKNRVKDERSTELLKELHILTNDWKLNQDSNRKLKQIYHLSNFIEPLIKNIISKQDKISIVDQGCGKSYLGFMLYDLFLRHLDPTVTINLLWVDNREDLMSHSEQLATKLGFKDMKFFCEDIISSINLSSIPDKIDIVTALHACDTATDDTIQFAITKNAQYIVLVPCCQAEVCSCLTASKSKLLVQNQLSEIWRHPLHTRTFASHLTNVMRCLWLEANGYSVSVTELVGREHSMKNELIIWKYQNIKNNRSLKRLQNIIQEFGLQDIAHRYSV